jgi:hypothetical protein
LFWPGGDFRLLDGDCKRATRDYGMEDRFHIRGRICLSVVRFRNFCDRQQLFEQ